MIVFKDVSFRYAGAESEEGLHHINLEIPEGQVVLLCGESGCGKTTLTRLLNGLIPHYCDGELTGTVMIGDQRIPNQSVQETAKNVGSVFQNPRSQFFTVDTTSELAFGCENMQWPAKSIESRISCIADEFRIRHLLDRNLFQLSGGEKQKIACASVAAPNPDILVLDEPSSNLDIAAIKDLAGFIAAWKEAGKTVIIAEHRLRYILQLADRVVYMRGGEIAEDLSASAWMRLSEARVAAMGLRPVAPVRFVSASPQHGSDLELQDIQCFRDKKLALSIHRLAIPSGSVIAVLGDNGAGKSTFARCLCGLDKKEKGRFLHSGRKRSVKQRRKDSFLVMQDVGHQLFTESVSDELRISFPRHLGEEEVSKRLQAIMQSIHIEHLKDRHPQSLSGGEKQRVAIACAMASEKNMLFYDEPTSGLDLRHMEEVSQNIKRLQTLGTTQFVITHDPELVARCCDYILFLHEGQIAWKGTVDRDIVKRLEQYFSSADMAHA